MPKGPDRRWSDGSGAWLPLLLLPSAVAVLVPPEWPRWALMWLLAITIFAGCKWLTWSRSLSTLAEAPGWKRHLAYLLASPGMDARRFLAPETDGRRADVAPARPGWGTVGVLGGSALFFGVAPLLTDTSTLLAGWVAMLGLVFLLHFGAFELLAWLWQRAGVPATPLMLEPVRSTSLGEFWGRRWNTAFRDLTHRHLFRPLQRRFGAAGALWVSFLVSGLVHDLVISVPAGAGSSWTGRTPSRPFPDSIDRCMSSTEATSSCRSWPLHS